MWKVDITEMCGLLCVGNTISSFVHFSAYCSEMIEISEESIYKALHTVHKREYV